MSDYHPMVQQIRDVLDEHHVSYHAFEHEAVRTSEEAAALRPEYSLAQGMKALLIRVKRSPHQKDFVQVVVPGDQKFDAKKVRSVLNAKDIRFASEEEVSEITNGIKPGGVPPFGTLLGLPVYVDAMCGKHAEVIFNAGDKRYSIAMAYEDYIKVVQPTVVSVV